MSERKDENWLDDALRRAVNTTKPQFDAETWKQKYADEYQTLLSRRQQGGRPVTGSARAVRWILRHPIRELAVAAVLILAVALLLRPGSRPVEGPAEPPRPVAQRPARMLTMMSLRVTYRQGGEDALNQQLDDALDKLGPRPGTMSALQLYDELQG